MLGIPVFKGTTYSGEDNWKHCDRLFGMGLLEHKDWRINYPEWGGLPAGWNLQEGEWELVNEADLARLQRDGKNTREWQKPGQSSQIHLHLDLQILSIPVINIMRDHFSSLK